MLDNFSGSLVSVPVEGLQQTATLIKEQGIMVTISAAFILIAMGAVIFAFTFLKKTLTDLLGETRSQNRMLIKICEGLIPETLLRIKNMSGPQFDLAVYKVVDMVSRVRKENGLGNKEKTLEKIRTLVTNLHEDRNTRFDSFTLNGRKVSEYTNPEWIDWVSQVVENEVYAPKPNPERTYTNVKAIYEKIKIDFYKQFKEPSHG